jgi:hypothetical protein
LEAPKWSTVTFNINLNNKYSTAVLYIGTMSLTKFQTKSYYGYYDKWFAKLAELVEQTLFLYRSVIDHTRSFSYIMSTPVLLTLFIS